nr:ROK family transcriptional regulator [uncultured Cohaesibacter sp.]
MILNIIRRTGGLSRAELAIRTGLSAAAVGFVVKELLSDGYLIEDKPQGNGAGRKPVPLRLNQGEHWAIGLKLSQDKLECILTDLAMEPVDQRSILLERHEPDYVVGKAKSVVEELLKANSKKSKPILGVGWTMPAHLDTAKGVCIRSFRFNWHNVPIGEMLSNALNLPVFVEDDTLAFALAHYLFGLGQQKKSFGVFAVGEGIFFASVINGSIWRGEIGNAGKVGHIQYRLDGPRCECGRQGCLQTFFSVTALEKRWKELKQGICLEEAVQQENASALALVEEAGSVLGRYLSEWNTLVDHECIILGGESTAFGDTFLRPLKRALDEHYYREQGPAIIPDKANYYWTAGAAAVVVQHVFGSRQAE